MVECVSQVSDEPVLCPNCGSGNAHAARFCNQCAMPLEAATTQAPVGAERKQVTVLFSDLTGFTALSERLDPEETREIMNRVFGLAAEIVARYNGRIEKFIGDALMAIFGVPVAHEDDPVRAVRAALELHQAVATLSPRVQARTGTPIALHSGVNTGLVVTGEWQFDQATAGPLGDTINLAARLMGAAPGAEIWVGPATRSLVAHAFELEDLGAHDFKGKAAPVGVARVMGAASRTAGANQFRGSFVGRQAELGALLGAAERMRDGAPSVFAIRGDAGTGKTRLVAEFRAHVGEDVQWLEGRAYPYAQNIPYAPIIDLLSRSWSIEERDSQATVRSKLEAGIAALLPASGKVLPLFLHLYHLPQSEGVVIEREDFQQRLLDAMRQLLAALASMAPTVVCVQDLHWADNSTVILLNGLAEGLRVPVMLLSNYRPGYAPPPVATELELRELSPRQTAELLRSLLAGKPPEALTCFIEQRSDGNPFYVEEVVNSLVETGVLQRGDAGWVLTRPLSDAGVPATVTGVIAARIDRLDEPRRRVLRHAAVVGREFLYAIVAQVTDDTAELAPSLNELQAADLIRTRRPEPVLEYIFKHALTQEVAYDGLLKTERRLLHARTGYAMEAVLADRIDEFVETLAYHFQGGGVADKAVDYLTRAGAKCVARYALVEAQRHYRGAYALVPGDALTVQQCRTLAQLLIGWSQVHYYLDTVGEWNQLLEKHLTDAQRCNDAAVLAMYLGWLGNARAFIGNMRGSIEALDRALQLGRSVQAGDALAHVLAWRSFTLFELARVDEAIACACSPAPEEAACRITSYPYFKSQGGLGAALNIAGDFARARAVAQGLIEQGRSSGSTRGEGLGHWIMAIHWFYTLDFETRGGRGQGGLGLFEGPVVLCWRRPDAGVGLVGGYTHRCRPCADQPMGAFARTKSGLLVRPADAPGACRRAVGAWPFVRWNARLPGRTGGCARTGHAVEHRVGRNRSAIPVYRDRAPRRQARVRGAAAQSLVRLYPGAVCSTQGARHDRTPGASNCRSKKFHGLTGHGRPVRDGRFVAHQREQAQALECLERIHRRLRDAGIAHVPAPVAALAREIDAL